MIEDRDQPGKYLTTQRFVETIIPEIVATMFALLDAAVQQGTAGLAEDQYLGFVGIPKPPVRLRSQEKKFVASRLSHNFYGVFAAGLPSAAGS